MPTIIFASPKGGAGKSTSAVVIACELSRSGIGVVIIDADPNRPVSKWAKLEGRPANLSVVADITESSIIDEIESWAAKVPFVVVDLEGTASMTVAYAISRADLVIIPVQGSQLDASEAAKAIRLIRQQEKAFGRQIQHAVLFTRTSAVIKPRLLQHIRSQLRAAKSPFLMHKCKSARPFAPSSRSEDLGNAETVSSQQSSRRNRQCARGHRRDRRHATRQDASGGCGMTADTRAAVFDAEDDLDLSGFAPKAKTVDAEIGASKERIRAVAEPSSFRSRDAAPAVPKRELRRYRTGRNVQLNLKVRQEDADIFYALADEKGWVLGEAFQMAVAALRSYRIANGY